MGKKFTAIWFSHKTMNKFAIRNLFFKLEYISRNLYRKNGGIYRAIPNMTISPKTLLIAALIHIYYLTEIIIIESVILKFCYSWTNVNQLS